MSEQTHPETTPGESFPAEPLPAEGLPPMHTEPRHEEPIEEPAPERESQEADEPGPARRGGGFAIFLSLLALTGTGGAGAGGYWLWQQLEQLKAAQAAAQQTKPREDPALAQLTREQRELKGRLSQLGQELEAMAQGLRSQGEQVAVLRAIPPPMPPPVAEPADLLTAEAGYLLRLAEHQLGARDPAGALATQEAAARLLGEGGPELEPVRATLDREMQALAAVPAVDRPALLVRLGGLAQAIETLALPGATPPRYAGSAAPAPERYIPPPWEDWDGFTAAIGEDLKKLVSVKEGAEARLPVAGPEQQFFLRQNLLLKVDLARLALLQGHGDLYRQQLTEAEGWLLRYLGEEAAAPVLGPLRQLAAQPVDAPLPTLGAARAALERVAAARPATLGGQRPMRGEPAPAVEPAPAPAGALAPPPVQPEVEAASASGSGLPPVEAPQGGTLRGPLLLRIDGPIDNSGEPAAGTAPGGTPAGDPAP